MISPFTHLNAAKIRAEARARLRRKVQDAAIIALMAVIALIVADMALTTALALPETIAQAEQMEGM
ncbi:MAG: hypothetical protein JNK19_03000 [Tabrizicola sp.]|nr:hypothetical protein [Tabrizicola sp.]